MAVEATFCSDQHEEIAFEGTKCPMCSLQDRVERIFAEMNDLYVDFFDANPKEVEKIAPAIAKALPKNVVEFPKRSIYGPPKGGGAA